MLKYFMPITACFIVFTAQAQSSERPKANDPDTKKNAAKADRHVVRNRSIFDTSIQKTADTCYNRKKLPRGTKTRSNRKEFFVQLSTLVPSWQKQKAAIACGPSLSCTKPM
jgi:hypothetical protein